MQNIIFGQIGESIAVKFLKKKKFKILQTNYKNTVGEIDIIAKDKDFLVFVEVKSRNSEKYGRPSLAVTSVKQNKIRQVASVYLIKNKLTEAKCRFDVVEVLDQEINHIEDAF